jgi:hypothetical protein
LIKLRYSDEIYEKLNKIQTYYETNYRKNKFLTIEAKQNYYGVWIDSIMKKIKCRDNLKRLVIYHRKNNKLKEYLGKNDKKIKIGLGVVFE